MKYLIAAALTAAVVFIGTQIPAPAWSHDKQLSQKTLCHKQRGAHPHWHVNDDPKQPVAGPCREENGRLVQVPPPPKMIQIESEEYLQLVRERDQLRGAIEDMQAEADRQDHALRVLRGDLRAAETVASDERRRADAVVAEHRGLVEAAHADRAEAAQVLREAVARERGAGPKTGRDCRKALRRYVLDADTGWMSSSVSVDEDERRALRRACID